MVLEEWTPNLQVSEKVHLPNISEFLLYLYYNFYHQERIHNELGMEPMDLIRQCQLLFQHIVSLDER